MRYTLLVLSLVFSSGLAADILCAPINAGIGLLDSMLNISGIPEFNIGSGGGTTEVTFSATGVHISDFKTIEYETCKIEENYSEWLSVMKNLVIHCDKYDLIAVVPNLVVTGGTEAEFRIDDFSIKIWGNGTTNGDGSFQFTDIMIDFEMLRWWVEFEGIMPGTDLGYVLNSFLTMLGPELFDGLEVAINTNEQWNGVFMNLCNAIMGVIPTTPNNNENTAVGGGRWVNGIFLTDENLEKIADFVRDLLKYTIANRLDIFKN